MATYEDLKRAVDEMNREYRRPDIDEDLRFSEPYDIRTDFGYHFPNYDCAGVYAIFHHDGTLLRIGKVSCNNTLGKRLSSYFKWNDTKTEGHPNHEGYENAKIIRTLAVPEKNAFEAAAIEEFLLSRVSSPYNKNGSES